MFFDILFGILFALVTWAIYFLPAVIAFRRHHRRLMAISVLNVFAGWTFLGWIAALIWACSADVEHPTNYRGYFYVVEKDGRARLELSNGEWTTYPSEEMAKRDVDIWSGSKEGSK